MSYQQPYPPNSPYPTQPQYPTPPLYQTYPSPPPPKRANNLPIILTIATATLLIVAVVAVLALRSGGFLNGNSSLAHNTPQTTRTTPTTPTASPTFTSNATYQADWTNGLNGWTGSNVWSVSNGVLYSNGSATGNILAPFSPGHNGLSDYQINAFIRILGANDSFFGLVARGQGNYSNLTGYIGGMAGVTDNAGTISGDIAISYVGYPGNAPSKTFSGDASGWHLYSLYVAGSHIQLTVDGVESVTFNDARFSAGGEVGLRAASGTRIAVRSFTLYPEPFGP